MHEKKYGELAIEAFDVSQDLEIWPNKHAKNYIIHIEFPEFTCLCPRSGYPDFATFTLEYTPNASVVELKAVKLYVNSFRNRAISHEDSANEFFDTLYAKLSPKWMRLKADFYPRGNVHTIIEIDSSRF
ncbi:MAG: 7-cyano-7-deazaguanine reductase [Sulfuricurvum sp. PC08-66]|nr:MAG: 7-cyano-7-deazaguanine reductase [Sulfuricurvum sp. PC08-66]